MRRLYNYESESIQSIKHEVGVEIVSFIFKLTMTTRASIRRKETKTNKRYN
jgi:hypothetical protein